MKTAFMYPGQGAQYYHMGRDLLDREPTFRHAMVQMDQVVQTLIGRSVMETLYSDRSRMSDPFDRLLLTNPAIFMIEVALSRVLAERGLTPDMVLGASLGTFAAATTAGMLDAEEALACVVRLAQVVEAHCDEGAMIAVLAPLSVYESTPLAQVGAVASMNYPQHFVLSCSVRDLDFIESFLRSRSIAFQRLPVQFAFHSSGIDMAQQPVRRALASLRWTPAKVPLACCAQRRLITSMSVDSMWAVVRRPIQFSQTIAMLEAQGPWRYVDVGPTDTLATFLKYLLPPSSGSRAVGLLSPYRQGKNNLAL